MQPMHSSQRKQELQQKAVLMWERSCRCSNAWVFTAKSQEIYDDLEHVCLDAWFLARALAAVFWIGCC